MAKRTTIFLVAVMVVFFYAVSVGYGFSDDDLQILKKTSECPNCDLAGAYLTGSRFPGANLSGANLSNAIFIHVILTCCMALYFLIENSSVFLT